MNVRHFVVARFILWSKTTPLSSSGPCWCFLDPNEQWVLNITSDRVVVFALLRRVVATSGPLLKSNCHTGRDNIGRHLHCLFNRYCMASIQRYYVLINKISNPYFALKSLSQVAYGQWYLYTPPRGGGKTLHLIDDPPLIFLFLNVFNVNFAFGHVFTPITFFYTLPPPQFQIYRNNPAYSEYCEYITRQYGEHKITNIQLVIINTWA